MSHCAEAKVVVRLCRKCGGPMYKDEHTRDSRHCHPCLRTAEVRYQANRRLGKIRPAVRARVIGRDGWRRRHCGIAVRRRTHKYDHAHDTIEIDHLVRVADGGRGDESNLVVSCFRCNHRKQHVKTTRAVA